MKFFLTSVMLLTAIMCGCKKSTAPAPTGTFKPAPTQWVGTPGPVNAETVLAEALDAAQTNDRIVFVHLTSPG